MENWWTKEKGYVSYENVFSKWDIGKNDLIDRVLDGSLRPYLLFTDAHYFNGPSRHDPHTGLAYQLPEVIYGRLESTDPDRHDEIINPWLFAETELIRIFGPPKADVETVPPSYADLLKKSSDQPEPQNSKNPSSKTDHETFIRSLIVSTEGDADLRIREPGKPAKSFNCTVMGFGFRRGNNKQWQALTEI